MLRNHSAVRTGQGIACLVAMLLSVTAAHAQSSSRQTTTQIRTATEKTEASTEPAPARFFRISDVLAKAGTAQQPRDSENVRVASLGNDDFLSDAPLRGSIPQIGEEPFGLFAFRAPEGSLWRKWRGVEADIAVEGDLITGCLDQPASCTPAAKRYLAIVDAVKARSGRARLEEVNRQINGAIRYTNDMTQHGVPDRWSAPVATLASGRGDCEDYAIAKYVILREAGYPSVDLRFLLVRDRIARDDHAVLAARLDGQWLILDNRFAAIPEDHRMHNFTPLYALDHEGVKLIAAPYAKRAPTVADSAPAVADSTPATPATMFEDTPLRGTLVAETQTTERHDLKLHGTLAEDTAAAVDHEP